MCEGTPKSFLNLVKNNLDIIFANEQEIMSLIGTQKFEEVINFTKKETEKLIIVTRGDKGALAIKKDEVVECSAKKNIKIKDLTGVRFVCSWFFAWFY